MRASKSRTRGPMSPGVSLSRDTTIALSEARLDRAKSDVCASVKRENNERTTDGRGMCVCVCVRTRASESCRPGRRASGFSLDVVVLPAAPRRRTKRVAIFYGGRGRKTDNLRRREEAVSARISGRGTGRVAFKLSETRAKTNGPRWAIWLLRGLLIHANSFAIFAPSTSRN